MAPGCWISAKKNCVLKRLKILQFYWKLDIYGLGLDKPLWAQSHEQESKLPGSICVGVFSNDLLFWVGGYCWSLIKKAKTSPNQFSLARCSARCNKHLEDLCERHPSGPLSMWPDIGRRWIWIWWHHHSTKKCPRFLCSCFRFRPLFEWTFTKAS